MDDTQKEGSDSDWDSTLDFTSPRQVGIGKLRPDPATEIDEESALSEESDIDAEESLPNDKQVIRNGESLFYLLHSVVIKYFMIILIWEGCLQHFISRQKKVCR